MADRDTPAAYSALFLAAGPLDWPVLLTRLGPLAVDVCRTARLPEAAVDAALATGRGELVDALLHNPQRRFDKSVDARLAKTGARAVAEAAFDQRWPTVLRRDVLVALRTAEPGVPELLRRMLADYFRITRLEYVLAAHRLNAAAGPESVRAAVPGHHHNAVHTAIRAGLDANDLDAVLEAEQGTPGLIRLLREHRIRDLDLYSTVDWTAILAAHAEQPFDRYTVGALVAREDCPQEVVRAMWAAYPALVAETAHTVGRELWDAPTAGPVPPEAITALAARLLPRDARPLDEARPAAPVLEALLGQDDAAEARAALSARMADYGADVKAWATLCARLEAAEGTVTALLDEVDVLLAVGEFHDGGFPDGAGTAFVALLGLADVEVQSALLPHLDDRTVQELFTLATWRPEWLPLALGATDLRVRRALPRRAELPVEAVDSLVDIGDPDLIVLLLAHGHLAGTHRDRILAAPVEPELRGALLGTAEGWRAEDIVSCTDPELRRHVMRHVRVDEFIPQVRLLLGVWEREGAEAAFALLNENLISSVPASGPGFFDTPTDVYMRHRAMEDHGTALRELRRLVADHDAEEPPPWEGPAADALRAGKPVAQIFDLAHAASEDEDYSYAGWERSAVAAGELTWHDLIAFGHPASHVAAQMVPHYERFDEQARLALSALLDSTLGTNPDAWVLALRLLPDFTGTLSDLLRTVGRIA